LFILALRGLSSPATSRAGNRFGMAGMLIAVVTTLLTHEFVAPAGDPRRHRHRRVIGFIIARKIAMTACRSLSPRSTARRYGGGGCRLAAYLNPGRLRHCRRGGPISFHRQPRRDGLGVAIGAITFSGSVIAFLKLNGNMSGAPILLPLRHVINLGTLLRSSGSSAISRTPSDQAPWVFWTVTALSFLIGFLLIIPIGGADMPVVVSMLNSYSGWAAAAMGFTLHNTAMIITGALVGSSGAILSYIMCKAMNRSFISVIAGGFGAEAGALGGEAKEQRPWKRGSADDAAFLMSQAESVIIVPGYGMAVAQAQHALREMADLLKKAEGVRSNMRSTRSRGACPGHMNVLLAEANVPYDEVFELEDINGEFAQADVAFVIGANDVTNPAAKTDRPRRSTACRCSTSKRPRRFVRQAIDGRVGYAGVDNDVFYMDNTMMLLADAKKMVEDIVKALRYRIKKGVRSEDTHPIKCRGGGAGRRL
jgi:NAD(P) transhydrogenase subunit beta